MCFLSSSTGVQIERQCIAINLFNMFKMKTSTELNWYLVGVEGEGGGGRMTPIEIFAM